MVIDLAGQNPVPWVVSDHLHVGEGGGEQADGVRVAALVGEDLPVEVGCVDIHLVAHPKQVPVDLTAYTHAEAWQVPIHVAGEG